MSCGVFLTPRRPPWTFALGANDPFIYKLVPVLTTEMGEAFPEIKEKEQHIQNVLKVEEESFGRTLETGLEMIDRIARKVKVEHQTVIDGEEVFRLYDTYGFPYDLTEIIAGEKGLTLDKEGFDKAMGQQQERSRAGANFKADTMAVSRLLEKDKLDFEPTEFIRNGLTYNGTIQRVYEGKDFGAEDDVVALILDTSPFYVEAGGQISDTGKIFDGSVVVEVFSLYNHQNYYVHIGKVVEGSRVELKPGLKVSIEVDSDRRWDIMRNHTATHLMHAALRQVLGEHVKQSGSYVGPDRLRFDFSHHQPMTEEEIARVEELVNAEILNRQDVKTDEMNIDEAKKSGAMALFGEKYGDKVRVVSVPGFSKELCGGTHVDNVSEIGPFVVVLETGIASGVRRIEAITGREAIKYMLENKMFRRRTAEIIGRPESEALKGVEQLKENEQALQKELKRTKEAMFTGGSKEVGDKIKIGGLTLITYAFGETDRDTMGAWIDSQKGMAEPLVATACGTVNGKDTFMAAATGAAVKDFKFDAGKFTKKILADFGGRGGGKPSFAQGTTADGTNADDVFKGVRKILEQEYAKKS